MTSARTSIRDAAPLAPRPWRLLRAGPGPLLLVLCLAGCGRLAACSSPEQTATSLETRCPEERMPHDHTPLHGGQVGMVGEYHLEVVDTGSELRVYFSDACRSPLAPPRSGAVVLEAESGAGDRIERPLVPAGDHLRAGRSGVEIPFLATIKARVGPHQTEMSFLFFEPPLAER